MDSDRLCFVVNDLEFFLSHRIDLAKKLSYSYQIHLICNSKNASTADLKTVQENKFLIHDLSPRNKSKLIYGYIQYLVNLKRLLCEINADYILFITLELSFIGAIIHQFIETKKSLFLITGLGPFFNNKRIKYKIIKLLQKIAFIALKNKKNFLFIFQNPDDLKLFVTQNYIKKSQALLIKGNGINMKYFSFLERKFEKKLTFLFASRLVQSKGIIEFIEASKIILAKYPSTKFLIAGKFDDSDPESINYRKLEVAILDNSISYLGNLSQAKLKEYFYKSSVFIMPSYGEGLPKVALEAASTGMPIIATDVNGCRECVIPGHNGFLVEAMDAKGLAKAMESLIVNTLNLSQYSRNSYQMVKNEYSLELITKEYLNALN
jgi:glycosyltransferase involved in cell wall biosynthesis